MSKKLFIRDRVTGRDDQFVIEMDDNGTRSEVELATTADMVTGSAKNRIATAQSTNGKIEDMSIGTDGVLAKNQHVVLGSLGQLDWASITPDFVVSTGRDNAFIKMGTWATPISITQTNDHWVPFQINIKKAGNIQFDTAAARLRVDTNGAQALSAIGCLQLRQNLGHNVGSSAILNASVNVSGAVTVGLGSVLGGYFSIEGSGTITKAGANDCTALVAVNNMASTGAGLDNVFIAMQNGTGSTVTDIAKITAVHGNATNALHIYATATDSAITTAIKIFGAITNVLDFTGASVGVLEDSKAFPDKAGSIKVLLPSGGVGYINVYDGTAST